MTFKTLLFMQVQHDKMKKKKNLDNPWALWAEI